MSAPSSSSSAAASARANTGADAEHQPPQVAQAAVLVRSEDLEGKCQRVRGYAYVLSSSGCYRMDGWLYAVLTAAAAVVCSV